MVPSAGEAPSSRPTSPDPSVLGSADPARGMLRRAVVALAIVGVFAVGTYLLFERALRATASDAPVISAAGRQRMLTQKITNLLLEIQVAAERKQFAFLTADLRTAYAAWASVHRALQTGDPALGLPRNTDAEVALEFERIRPDYEAIRNAVRHLLDDTKIASPEAAYEQISRRVLTVLDHADPFADGMDRIAALYLAHAQGRVTRMKHVVFVLTGSTLLVLLLEGLLVFRPAARLIRCQFLAQRQLAEESRKLALVASHTDNAVIITDAEGRTEWVNEAFVRTTGYTLSELRGEVPHVLVRDAALDAGMLDGLGAKLAARQAIRLEVQHRRKDGSLYWGDVEGVPIADEEGRIRRFIAIERDITDRKRAEDEVQGHAHDLALARDEALASARAKAEFLANMSHEIRTPMNGVIGMIELLLATPLGEEQRDYAATVRQSAEALLTVINDILDFSRIESGKMLFETIDFDLRAVIEDVSDLLAPRAHEKGLDFACVLGPDTPIALRGDPARLRQMIINLTGNAIKFTAAGEVAIEAQAVAETPERATIRVAIRDTGIGISKDRQAAVFESFTQADGSTTRRYGGTGLGLTISRQIAELMGGTIGVESEPGRGSTFWIEIPFEKAAGRIEPAAPETFAGRRVLVVDDNATNRRALRGQLVSWGMRPDEAASGREALDVLRAAGGEPFAVVLLDMQMPDMDGEQTARAIKAEPRLCAVPLVLLSSAGVGFASDEEMHASGFAAALSKPARASRLFNALAQVLGGAARPSRPSPAREARRIDIGLHVLLAEDNPVNQKVTQRMLEQWGCRVELVRDGREAVAAWTSGSHDLVLMDVQMPEMDGYEATAEIRRREAGTGRHTPVIAMTAHAMQGDEQRCLDAGMDAYIAKPVKPALLEAALRPWTRRAEPGRASAGGSAIADGALIDTGRLEQLTGDDEGFRREIIGDFLALAPELLARIESSIGKGDSAGVEQASHSLKGSSNTVGAVALGAVCAELEKLGRQGALDAARDGVARAREQLGRLRTALGDYLEAGERDA